MSAPDSGPQAVKGLAVGSSKGLPPGPPSGEGRGQGQSPGQIQAQALAALVQLEQRLRACTDEVALGFMMVNDTHALAPYRHAALWQGFRDDGDGRVVALSGLAVPEPNAPFNVWLSGLLARHAASPAGRSPGPLPAPEDGGDAAMWAEHLSAQAWWLPLRLRTDDAAEAGITAVTDSHAAGEPLAGLLLLRDQPWTTAETALLTLLADAQAHAWRALRGREGRDRSHAWRQWLATPRRRRIGMAVAALALLAVLAWPMRQSVLAPGEIVARAPEMVRAPQPGIVDRIEVQPNQPVKAGQLLAALDARELQAKLEAARQALAVAEAEWRQGQQQALLDERSKAGLALQKGKRDQAAADLDYFEQAIARTQLRAERDGIALFDDPADWIGRPVALGERILMVADPGDAELEVQLPVSDAIALTPGARIQLFLNANPAAPLTATLLRVGYRAAPTPDGTLAYRVRAQLEPAQGDGDAAALRRVGLKGTAKLYGERTVFAVYLLRRPLASLRVWLGL